MTLRWLCGLFPSMILASTVSAGDFAPQKYDWPQWQGQARTAVSTETGLLKSWPKDGPRLAWKVTGLGDGYSTPSIAAGRIFTMGNRANSEYVIALDEKDGKELWATSTGPVRANGGGYPGPRCTPTVDGDVLYALGLNGDLLCLDVANGKERWRKDLRKDFAGSVGGWGYCESPLIDGDKVIITPGGKKATLAALNKKTGETIWLSQVPSGESAAYASVIVADVGGQKQYIQFLSHGVVGVLAEDGKYLWRYDKPANQTANCTTAVYSNNHVFAASNYGVGGGLAKLTREGDATTAKEVYFTPKMQNHHGGMVLVGKHLYGSGPELTCIDFLSGKIEWQGKAGKGSIAVADGHFYYRNEGGPIILAEVRSDKYVEKGRFNQPDRSRAPAWPHPIVANGKLYIRDQDLLLCYDVKAKK